MMVELLTCMAAASSAALLRKLNFVTSQVPDSSMTAPGGVGGYWLVWITSDDCHARIYVRQKSAVLTAISSFVSVK